MERGDDLYYEEKVLVYSDEYDTIDDFIKTYNSYKNVRFTMQGPFSTRVIDSEVIDHMSQPEKGVLEITFKSGDTERWDTRKEMGNPLWPEKHIDLIEKLTGNSVPRKVRPEIFIKLLGEKLDKECVDGWLKQIES